MVAALVFGMTVPACPDGMEPLELKLIDASGTGCEEGGGLLKPYALGARLDINVRVEGIDVAVTDVTLSAPDVWSFVDGAEVNPVSLRAETVGTSDITVRSAEGRTGTASLEVAAVATATITPWNLIQPFNLTTGLDAGPTDIASRVAQSGFALVPDGELRLGVTLKDAADRELGGYDVADWHTAPAGAVTVDELIEERSNDVIIHHGGGAAQDVTLTTIAGGTFTVSLVDSGAADSLELFNVESGDTGATLSIPRDTTRTVVALIYDAHGRFVIGNDGSPLQLDITNDNLLSIVPPPWSEGDGGIALDAESEKLLEDARVVYLRGMQEGETTLTLSAAGVSLEVTVTVTAALLPTTN
jgi:hypothetical protein